MKDIINTIVNGLVIESDNGVLRAVQEVGIDVDKDKLLKALQASEFVDRLIDHIFLLYAADEYMSVRTILEMLVEHGFVVRTEEPGGYRRK